MGDPQNGGFISWKILYTWMLYWYPPFSGYLHIHAMEKTPFVVDLFKLVIFYCYGSLPV